VTLVAECVKTGFRLLQFKDDFDIIIDLEGRNVFLKVLDEKCRFIKNVVGELDLTTIIERGASLRLILR